MQPRSLFLKHSPSDAGEANVILGISTQRRESDKQHALWDEDKICRWIFTHRFECCLTLNSVSFRVSHSCTLNVSMTRFGHVNRVQKGQVCLSDSDQQVQKYLYQYCNGIINVMKNIINTFINYKNKHAKYQLLKILCS